MNIQKQNSMNKEMMEHQLRINQELLNKLRGV